jgi:hypothetical protein
MLEYLRISAGLLSFAIAAGAILTAIYYLLTAIAHAKQRVRGADFLGPLIFVAPSFYDEGGRGKRIGRNLLLSLVVFVAFGALFVLIGEAGG